MTDNHSAGDDSFAHERPPTAPDAPIVVTPEARLHLGDQALPEEVAVAAQVGARPTVLVVDDESRNRGLVRAYLRTTYELHEAHNAATAFEILKQKHVDLVLLDVKMPEMTGFEACRAIKQMFGEQYLPVILLTALGEQEERNTGLESGADDFLTKPVDRHELLLRLRTFIKLKRQDEHIRRQMRELTERDERIQRQLEELEGVARDRKRAAEELQVVNGELEAFSYSVSHDLRAPLRALDAFSQILLADHAEQLDDEGRSHLERIRAAAAKMVALVDDLLNLARSSRRPLQREPVSLTEIARETVEELRQRDPARRVVWELAEGLSANVDGRLIAIALENLLGNAWKFTGGRTEAHIVFGQTHKDGQPAFFVRDDGAGFDAAYANKIFEPFQRLHSESQFGGTGIGLATVHRIISRHGGRVWADAAVDKGATFFFTVERGP